MLIELPVSSKNRVEFIDVTPQVQRTLEKHKVNQGMCHIYVPHTTAGITINENADPSVCYDIYSQLNTLIPFDGRYRHTEGNAAAHIKASIIGSSATVIIEGGKILLGTWQGIFFCEFDGPRHRRLYLKIVPDEK